MKKAKSLLAQAESLRKQAGKEKDLALRNFDLKYATKFYDAHLISSTQNRVGIFLAIVYIGSLAAIIYVGIKVSYLAAGGLFLVIAVLACIICAVYMKLCNKLTEKGFIKITLGALKYLFTFGKQPPK